jgi:cytochrome c-type biogenesis protein CcmH
MQNRASAYLGIAIARVVVALLVGVLLVSPAVALAQTSPEDVTPNQINEVARELWCPLCSGVRLDSCELKACDQMKEEIAIMIADGQNEEYIREYFIDQYGPQVLGEPPREGLNWLAWILPFAALAVGAVFLWSRAQHLVRPPTPEESDAAPQTTPAADDYESKLEEELKQYS